MKPRAPDQLQNKHILIVDDNVAILTTLTKLLRAHGLRVSTSDTADIQSRVVGEERPDVILLDLRLGAGQSGKEVCCSLKADKDTRDIVVVIMSANTDVAQVAEEAGGNGYVTKPFSVQELLETMAQSVDAARTAQEYTEKRQEHRPERTDVYYGGPRSWYSAGLAH